MPSPSCCLVCIYAKHEGRDLLCLKHHVKLPPFEPYHICRDFEDVSIPETAHDRWWINKYLPIEDVLYQHFEGYKPPEVVGAFVDMEQI